MNSEESRVDRRLFLGALGALPLSSAIAASAAFRGSFDPADPMQNLHALARLNGGIGTEPAIWWFKGRAYGMPVGELRLPVCGIVGCRIVIYRPSGAGFEIYTRDWGQFVTLDDQPLESLRNPFTGAVVAPRHILTAGYRWKIDPREGQILEPSEAGTVSSLVGRPFVMPWHRHGNQLWGRFETFVKYPNGAVGSEILAFNADHDAVISNRSRYVPATGTWVNESPWLPWLNMKGTPGGMLMVSAGQKEPDMAALPSFVRDLTAATFPGLLENPTTWKRPT